MLSDAKAKQRVLEQLIAAMDEREGARIPGAKPLLQITVAAGDEGGEGIEGIEDLAKARGQEIGEEPVMDPEHEAMEDPDTEALEHESGQELMPEGFEEMLEKKRKEKAGK